MTWPIAAVLIFLAMSFLVSIKIGMDAIEQRDAMIRDLMDRLMARHHGDYVAQKLVETRQPLRRHYHMTDEELAAREQDARREREGKSA